MITSDEFCLLRAFRKLRTPDYHEAALDFVRNFAQAAVRVEQEEGTAPTAPAAQIFPFPERRRRRKTKT